MSLFKLKIWPDFFEKVLAGRKNTEIREMDRDFKIGDYLLLQEWEPETQTYTGSEITVEITDIYKENVPFLSEDCGLIFFKRVMP